MKYRIPKTGKLVLYVETTREAVYLKSLDKIIVVFKDNKGIIYIDTIRLMGCPVRRGIYQFMNIIFDRTCYYDIKKALEYGEIIEVPVSELTFSKMIDRIQKRLETLE